LKEIKCVCGTLFGKEQDGVLAIKYRDLYRQIEGRVEGPCRGCGNVVRWPEQAKDIR
jgi:hypothetical protein